MARSYAGCWLGRWFRTVIRAASFKKIPGLVRAALLNTTAGTPIEICLQDAARLGQQGTQPDVGAPVGSRPLRARDNRPDFATIFGAICAQRGVGAALPTPKR